ncbi:hypothetical protein [Kitasatospora sp. NBC_01302]|uniref:hypothetical protein n=1 Tax=Kitasatospora sp. NBC_01302 TaxID=2903575 RepID=UPI002E0DD4D8|nr:hypothetical protein OG294_40195 [Kitasatospora sp. NBC_01302]
MTKTVSVPAPRRPGRDGRFPAYRGHTCQPYSGWDLDRWWDEGLVDEPEFRKNFKTNPWCWSPELGFHRARTPHIPVHLVGLTSGKFVGPKGMNMWQAIRLGAGWGIGTEPSRGRWVEQTWRVMVATDYWWTGDLEPVAQLGRLIGALVDGGGQDRIADDDDLLHGWFRDSTREFLPHPAIGDEWNDVLLRACHGDADLERDGAWVRAQEPAPAPRQRNQPWEPRIDLWDNLVGRAAHNGGMRIVCEVYKLTQPSPEQAMGWMTTAVRHALRWGQVDATDHPRPPADDD